MGFRFRCVYVLQFPRNYLSDVAAIAVGVRVRENADLYGCEGGGPVGQCTRVEFLTNGDGHEIQGRLVLDSEDEIVVEDLQRRSNDGAPVFWRFSPLTRDSLLDVEVQGRLEILRECGTDDALQRWYLDEFLPAWWVEFPREPETVRGSDEHDGR